MRYKNIKAVKRTHQVQLHDKNADRSARLTVLLKSASELKSTVVAPQRNARERRTQCGTMRVSHSSASLLFSILTVFIIIVMVA